MGQMLVNVIFKILNFVAGIFLTPLYSAISSVIPSLSVFFTKVLQFISLSTQYVTFAMKVFMIPPACYIPLFTLAVGIFAFNLSTKVIGLGMSIYHYFKP